MGFITYTGELTVLTCWCGLKHAVPAELRRRQLRQHNDGENVMEIFCPLGHGYVPSGESKAAKLERQLQRERQRHDQTRADRDHKENQRRAEKAAKTRLKNRARMGLCPCCNRHFKDLQRHINRMHPEFQFESEPTQ